MFSRTVLRIDPAQVAEEIETTIRQVVLGDLRRRGAVVGLSGGIDSSVVAALCVAGARPGAGRSGSSCPSATRPSDSLRLGRMLADAARHRRQSWRTSPARLAALGCYERQDEAIRSVFPEYGDGWQCKLVLPSILDGDRLNVAQLTVADPDGEQSERRGCRPPRTSSSSPRRTSSSACAR